jgi:hypothetical protein
LAKKYQELPSIKRGWVANRFLSTDSKESIFKGDQKRRISPNEDRSANIKPRKLIKFNHKELDQCFQGFINPLEQRISKVVFLISKIIK